MRQEYRAGKKVFVDYEGAKVEIDDAETGRTRQAQVFVAVLGRFSELGVIFIPSPGLFHSECRVIGLSRPESSRAFWQASSTASVPIWRTRKQGREEPLRGGRVRYK